MTDAAALKTFFATECAAADASAAQVNALLVAMGWSKDGDAPTSEPASADVRICAEKGATALEVTGCADACATISAMHRLSFSMTLLPKSHAGGR